MWGVKTTDAPWHTGGNAGGSIWPHFAEQLDAHGIPPVLFKAEVVGNTDFITGDWEDPAGAQYAAAIADMNAAGTGGFAVMLFLLGENDAGLGGAATYQANLSEFLDAIQANVTNAGSLKLIQPMLGRVNAETTALSTIRQSIKAAWAADPDVLVGPNLVAEDFADGVHYGGDPGGNAQLDRIADMYWRAFEGNILGGADPVRGLQVLAASVGNGAPYGLDQVLVTFDKAMQNHADAAGWRLSDDLGALTISTAAAATVNVANDSVLLTCTRDLDANVKVSFGFDRDAEGATLSDIGTDVDFPPEFTYEFPAVSVPLAPSNTVAPVIAGTLNVGDTLTVTDGGIWLGSPIPDLTYQWQRNGSNIDTETASTYVLVVADAGANITCDVKGTNSEGDATAASNTLVGAALSAPVNGTAPTISGLTPVGSVLTTVNGSWTGNDGDFVYTYRWLRDAVAISGATASTYTTVSADDTKTLTSEVTATNAHSGVAQVSSNNIVVGAVFDPTSLFSTEDGIIIDTRNAIFWQDAAKTVPADTVTDPVRVIEDGSGNGNDLVFPTDAARGVLRQGANGEFYVEFDKTKVGSRAAAASYVGGADDTLLFVMRDRGLAGDNTDVYLDSDVAAPGQGNFLWNAADNTVDLVRSTAGGGGVLTMGAVDANWHIWEIVLGDANTILERDATTDSGNIDNNVWAGIRFGDIRPQFQNGIYRSNIDLGALILINRNLTAQEETDVRAWLADRQPT